MGSLLVFEFVFEKLVLYFALKENYLAVIRYANLVQVAYMSFILMEANTTEHNNLRFITV